MDAYRLQEPGRSRRSTPGVSGPAGALLVRAGVSSLSLLLLNATPAFARDLMLLRNKSKRLTRKVLAFPDFSQASVLHRT